MATVTANQIEVRVIEMLELRVSLPRMWKPRLWLSARLMWLAAMVAGFEGRSVEIASV
jgi:hypothetical protein